MNSIRGLPNSPFIQKVRLTVLSIAVVGVTAMVPITAGADTLHATDDTYITTSQPNQNNGDNLKVFVRNAGTGSDRQTFVRFDLDALGAGLTGDDIEKATLRLWVRLVENEGSIDLHVVDGSWDEDTLTAATAPALDPAFATVAVTADDKLNFVTVDVTDAVRDWVDGVVPNDGIALLPNAVDDIRVTLDATENQGTSHPMELEVAMSRGLQISGIYSVGTPPVLVSGVGAIHTQVAVCDPGDIVTGGGFFLPPQQTVNVSESHQNAVNQWACTVQTGAAAPEFTFVCFAVCADVTP